MKLLIIRESPTAPPDLAYLKTKTEEEIKVNSVPEEGIAIYDCSHTEKPWDWAEYTIVVGTCQLGRNRADATINQEGAEEQILNIIETVITPGEGEEEEAMSG